MLTDGYRVHVEETGDLIIRHVLASDEGKYQCVAHNMAATRESTAVSLSVYGMKSNPTTTCSTFAMRFTSNCTRETAFFFPFFSHQDRDGGLLLLLFFYF